jgi:PIN domain nuclease of toxin-antitoxin system
MNYLLDTVAITRHFSGHGKVGTKAVRIMQQAEAGRHKLFVSVVSLFEVLYLSEGGRIKISLSDIVDCLNSNSCYSIVDLSLEVIIASETISFYEIHDRLILGTARHLNAPIISSDEKFDGISGIKRIW